MKTFRYSPRSFERALAAGVFGDRKVELLAGRPHVVTTNPPHVFGVRRLVALLSEMFPPDAYAIYEEKYVALGTWRPQPDVAVVRHPANAYLPRLAGPGDLELVAEVSDTTLGVDLGPKLRKYARSGIGVYWVLDLNDRVLHAFERPAGDRYESLTLLREGEAARGIAVADLLPPA